MNSCRLVGGASDASLIRRLSNEGQNVLMKQIRLKMSLIYKEYIRVKWNTGSSEFDKEKVLQYMDDILSLTNDSEGKTTFKSNERMRDLPNFRKGEVSYSKNSGMLLSDFFKKIEKSIKELEKDDSQIPFFLKAGYYNRASSKKRKSSKKSKTKKGGGSGPNPFRAIPITLEIGGRYPRTIQTDSCATLSSIRDNNLDPWVRALLPHRRAAAANYKFYDYREGPLAEDVQLGGLFARQISYCRGGARVRVLFQASWSNARLPGPREMDILPGEDPMKRQRPQDDDDEDEVRASPRGMCAGGRKRKSSRKRKSRRRS